MTPPWPSAVGQRSDDIEVTQVAKFRWASGRDDPNCPRDEVYDAMVAYARARNWKTVHVMNRLHLPGNWIWDDYVEESGE